MTINFSFLTAKEPLPLCGLSPDTRGDFLYSDLTMMALQKRILDIHALAFSLHWWEALQFVLLQHTLCCVARLCGYELGRWNGYADCRAYTRTVKMCLTTTVCFPHPTTAKGCPSTAAVDKGASWSFLSNTFASFLEHSELVSSLLCSLFAVQKTHYRIIAPCLSEVMQTVLPSAMRTSWWTQLPRHLLQLRRRFYKHLAGSSLPLRTYIYVPIPQFFGRLWPENWLLFSGSEG